MEEESPSILQSIFKDIEDPRVERTKRHQLLDIILIAILGVLCGAEGWVDIEAFGNTMRRSHDAANRKKALHMVSAWAVENRMVLAQVAVDEKSNAHYRHPGVIKSLGLGRLSGDD